MTDPTQIVVAPVLAVLVTAILTLLARPFPRVQRGLSLAGGLAYLAAVAMLWSRMLATPEGVLVYQLSNWDAPFGITLVADALSVFMLGLAAVVSVAALAFAVVYVDRRDQRLAFHPLFHLLLVGVTGSILTGDLFNLFVWFEVMLMASYVLVVFYAGPSHTRAAFRYVVLNLLGGAVMLLAVGGLYATTGTLNMADMARRLAAPAAYGIDPRPVLGLSALLFAVFALKAGLVPFQWWVPGAYRAAPAPVTAVLAGVVKKVGIYAIIRLYFTVFAGVPLSGMDIPVVADTALGFYGGLLFLTAVGSILLGGIGAITQSEMDGLLAYSSIGQIGFVVLPLAVAAAVPELAPVGIAAALVYAVNHGLAKGLLFLVSGAIYAGAGSTKFDELGGLAGRDPWLAGSFLVGTLALVGIPPLAGFFGKFMVFDVAGRAGAWITLAVALGGALLTVVYVVRAWSDGFWGDPVDYRREPSLVAVTVVLAIAVVVLGVAFDPFVDAAAAGGRAALDRSAYVEAVGLEVAG